MQVTTPGFAYFIFFFLFHFTYVLGIELGSHAFMEGALPATSSLQLLFKVFVRGIEADTKHYQDVNEDEVAHGMQLVRCIILLHFRFSYTIDAKIKELKIFILRVA